MDEQVLRQLPQLNGKKVPEHLSPMGYALRHALVKTDIKI